MLNGLWLGMVVLAVLVGAAAGRLREVTDGAFAMADLAVMKIALPLAGVMALWLGLMRLAERSGLVQTRKSGRSRTCTLVGSRLAEAEAWLAAQRALWETRSDRLVEFVERRDLGRTGARELLAHLGAGAFVLHAPPLKFQRPKRRADIEPLPQATAQIRQSLA